MSNVKKRRPKAPGRLIRAWGQTKSLKKWLTDPRCRARAAPVVEVRLSRGWSAARALSTPPRPPRTVEAWGETKCLTDWSRDPRCRVSRVCAAARLNRGWPPEAALGTPAGEPRPA